MGKTAHERGHKEAGVPKGAGGDSYSLVFLSQSGVLQVTVGGPPETARETRKRNSFPIAPLTAKGCDTRSPGLWRTVLSQHPLPGQASGFLAHPRESVVR